MLRGQLSAGRPHEGTADRNDGPLVPRHPGLVSEQTLQGQKAFDRPETDPGATAADEPAATPKQFRSGKLENKHGGNT